MTDPSIERLLETADKAFKAARTFDAEKLYARAEERAREVNDKGALVKALNWRGHCLQELCKFNTALAVLIEAVKTEAPGVDPADRYQAMASAISCSVTTLPLVEIKRLIAETEQQLSRWNRQEWRHMLLSQQAHCSSACGDFYTAKSFSWEAIRVSDADLSDGPGYLRMGNLCTTARLCFYTSDIAGIASVEAKAKNTKFTTEYCRANKVEISLYAARLTAPHKRLPLALVDQAEDAAVIHPDSIPLFRAIALAGQWDRARRGLAKMRPDPTDSSIFFRGLLRGDITLMEARAASHLPSFDDEIAEDRPPPSQIVVSPGVRDLLTQAKAEYDAIAPAAIREDTRLETEYYIQQLTSRQARLLAIWSALAN